MAVIRTEFGVDEVRQLLALVGHPPRGTDLFRIRRELARGLARGEQAERDEKEHMRQLRAARRVPAFDDEPLIPQSMSRRNR